MDENENNPIQYDGDYKLWPEDNRDELTKKFHELYKKANQLWDEYGRLLEAGQIGKANAKFKEYSETAKERDNLYNELRERR